MPVHIADGIGQDSGTGRETALPVYRTEVIVLLSPDDKVYTDAFDVVKTLKVIVCPVKDVECVLLIRYDIHRLGIMQFGRRDVKERRNLSLNII